MTACKQHVFKVHGIEIPKGVGVKKFFDGLPKDPELAAEHVRKTAVKGKKPKPLPTPLAVEKGVWRIRERFPPFRRNH